MKISHCSDLHLDFQNYPFRYFNKDNGGDVLILDGDIVTAQTLLPNKQDADSRGIKRFLEKTFIDWLNKYDHVLYVMGNHEHYRGNIKTSAKIIKDYFTRSNVNYKFHLMENSVTEIGGVLFFGATLWTDFEKNNPISKEYFSYMNDSKLIKTTGMVNQELLLTAEHVYDIHMATRRGLEIILENNKNTPTVVATHHAPTFKSCQEHVRMSKNISFDGCYASDLSELILSNPQIKVWINGHTHARLTYNVGDTIVTSNPRGYYGERSFKIFEETVKKGLNPGLIVLD